MWKRNRPWRGDKPQTWEKTRVNRIARTSREHAVFHRGQKTGAVQPVASTMFSLKIARNKTSETSHNSCFHETRTQEMKPGDGIQCQVLKRHPSSSRHVCFHKCRCVRCNGQVSHYLLQLSHKISISKIDLQNRLMTWACGGCCAVV